MDSILWDVILLASQGKIVDFNGFCLQNYEYSYICPLKIHGKSRFSKVFLWKVVDFNGFCSTKLCFLIVFPMKIRNCLENCDSELFFLDNLKCSYIFHLKNSFESRFSMVFPGRVWISQ